MEEVANKFSCPVCLDLVRDPVTTSCGHTFCKVCLNRCWDQEDWKGIYNCPLCRCEFSPRPVLHLNIMLSEVMEELRKKRTEIQPSSVGNLSHYERFEMAKAEFKFKQRILGQRLVRIPQYIAAKQMIASAQQKDFIQHTC